MKKILSILLAIMVTISGLSVVSFTSYGISNSEMSVYFIDCGQGDSIFITSNNKTMLVDAGKESNSEKVLKFLDNQGIKKIDYVFSSHPDEDHIGGMPLIYEKYQVDNSFYSSYVANTSIYQRYIEAVKNEPNSYYSILDENTDLSLGYTKIDVLSDGKKYSNANDASLVLKVTCGNKSLLLTGDISKTVEKDLVMSDKDIDVDILKVGHHGSASSSDLDFLEETSPDVAVISVGKDNSYGHPSEEVLNRLSGVCNNIYQTDKQGTILLEVNDNDITYNDEIIDTEEDSYCVARTVYVTANGKKYHATSTCSNMKAPISKSLTQAKELGYTACSKCITSDFENGKNPHKYEAATCTTPKTCTQCGITKGKALGHKFTDNCDKYCNVCKASRTVKHSYKNIITKATLSKNGKIQYKCTDCGYVSKTVTTIKSVKTIKISATSYAYNGKKKTPTVTVKDSNGKTLKNNTHYTVTYSSGRKNVGTYKVVVKMKGNYSGSKTLTFKINPKAASVNKLTAGKKAIKVKINRSLSQSTGYQIQYSNSKTFKSAKITTVKSSKTSSVTLKKLSSKKVYYVRIRTYKTVGKTKYYSDWSKYKYIKTK